MPLAHYGCPMGEEALSDGQQVDMPNMAKNMAKNCQNMPQIGRKSSKQHQFWPTGFFTDVLARAGHFKGLHS